MATLERIRQKGLLLSIVIGVAMLLFIIGMVDFNSIFGSSRQNVAEVDGDEITIMDYEQRVDEMSTFYKIEMGQSSLPDQYVEQVRSSVWNAMLKEIILGNQCEKLGITVSDEEIESNISGENPHPMMTQLRLFYNQEKGGFDSSVVEQVKSAAENEPNGDIAKYLSFVTRTVRTQLLDEKYSALTGASININDIDAKYNFDAKRSAAVAYTSTPYYTIADSTLSASTKELNNYYKDNKNKYFRDKESREIEYLVFPIEPSESDYADIQAWIEGLKNEFFTSDDYVAVCNQNSDEAYTGIAQSKASVDKDIADFAFSGKAGDTFGPQLFGKTYKMARIVETGITAPDSAKVRHILVVEATPERTKEVADSLVAALKGGADFAAAAKAFSKAGTGAGGGELGWIKEGDMDKEFSIACMKSAVNAYTTYDMNGGIQIINVTEKTKPVAKVKVCVLSRAVEASSQTYGQLFNEASQYMAQNNELSKFESAADPAQGKFIRTMTLSKADTRVADLKDSRQIIRWAFENKAGDVADKVFECGDKYVVAALKSVSKEGYPELKEISDQIASDFKKEKKGELIAADLNGKLAGGDDISVTGVVNTLESVSQSSQYVNGLGAEPQFVATVANMNADSKPAVVKGNNGVYVVKVTAVTEPGEFNAASEISQLDGRRPYRYMIFSSLEDAADITDNRINFY